MLILSSVQDVVRGSQIRGIQATGGIHCSRSLPDVSNGYAYVLPVAEGVAEVGTKDTSDAEQLCPPPPVSHFEPGMDCVHDLLVTKSMAHAPYVLALLVGDTLPCHSQPEMAPYHDRDLLLYVEPKILLLQSQFAKILQSASLGSSMPSP